MRLALCISRMELRHALFMSGTIAVPPNPELHPKDWENTATS